MTTPTVNKAAWSLLIDDDGNDAIGKVTASPEANTVLGRLKAIADGGAGVAYAVGDVVTYGGAEYECRQAHTSISTWTPAAVEALWLPL